MTDGLDIGRALGGAFACSVPVPNGCRRRACLREVTCEQLGLSFGYVRKLLGQHPRNALMELAPATADECRVRGLLRERMLEDEA